MKKIIMLISILFLLAGCTIGSNTAKSAIDDYLNGYRNLSTEVLTDMEKVIENENLTDDQKDVYREILKKQYRDLKYEIISEAYDGDNAVVSTKITVYDYYKAQKEAADYLKNNINEFYTNGTYDNKKYMDYKLNKMKNTTDTVDYTIDFNVVREADLWKLKEISSTDLAKIHGIYNYEGA